MNASTGSSRPPTRGGARGRRAVADSPRALAYDTLAAVTRDDAYANLVLPRLLAQHGTTGRDAAFATELAYGTLRRRGSLDAVVAAASGRDVSAVDPPVLDVLRLGAYQLLHTRVARHAAVDTTVSQARRVCGHRVSGFVNAVMRKISTRGWSNWLRHLSTGDEIADLALEHAHPEWIVRAFAEALGGREELPEALAADNAAPAVHLCARPGFAERGALADSVDGAPGKWSPHTVYMSGGDPADVPAVRQGRAHVQDEGSQLVAAIAAAAPVSGEDTRWLDLCAGPGGKAALLGALAARRGAHVTAVEVSRRRADLTRKSTAGLPVTTLNIDGREHAPRELYDRVLVDAPCSGLGALRRRPEARWRRSEADVVGLVSLQHELLAAALRLTRPGGVVAYATCSPVLAETSEVVDAATGVSRVDVRDFLPSGMPYLGDGPAVQLWPHRHGTDAMFLTLIRRVS
ncbi:MAG: RsmB/NOP family class I SAM-dependent RNA methyltransferase [Stackebrandtia sp.]